MDLTEETYYTSLNMRSTLTSFLTPRLLQIAGLVALGLSDKEIAQRLGVTFNTLKNQETNLRKRVGVRGRTSIAVFVITGWLPPGAACPTPLDGMMDPRYSTGNRAA
jgi:DNA-binding NarL/FixJ family response regulator